MASTSSTLTLKCDPDYFIDDGNTFILVEDTLFKVHRSTLVRDKSAFECMFSMSSLNMDNYSPEGLSDDNPIRLQGDSPEEFHDLLWSLYALPHEVMLALTPEADPLLLFNVARMAHKYQYHSVERWALGALATYYKRPLINSSAQQSPTLIQITELAVLCNEASLLDAAVSCWKRLIGGNKDISLALSVAEQYNLRGLLGLAYNAMMLRGHEYWDVDPLLTKDQRARLISGHYTMTRLWWKIDLQPPTLVHDEQCVGAAVRRRCEQSWATLWKAINVEMGGQVVALQQADVLGKMMLAESVVKALVRQEIPARGLLNGMLQCSQAALDATNAKVKEIKETLADYFTDDGI